MAASFRSHFQFIPDARVKLVGNPAGKAVIIGLLTAVLGLVLGYLPLGSDLEEDFGLNLLFKVRGSRSAPPQVVVIAIDKDSADRLGLPLDPQKWPRSYHTRIVQRLTEAGARVIAFDLFFGEGRSSDEDRALAKAIGAAGNVVLLGYFKKEAIPIEDPSGIAAGEVTVEKMISPASIFAKEAASVSAFPLPKVPLTVSQIWTFKDDSGDFPTMPVTVFQLFSMPVYDDFIHLMKKSMLDPRIAKGQPNERDRSSIEEAGRLVSHETGEAGTGHSIHNRIRSLRDILGHDTLISQIMIHELNDSIERSPDAVRDRLLAGLLNMYRSSSSRYLNYYGPSNTIVTVPYYQALEGAIPVSTNGARVDFKDKIVFVGASEVTPYSQMDAYPTVFTQRNGQYLSGVEICATAVANLLEDGPVRPIGFPAQLLIFSIVGLGAGFIGIRFRPMLAVVGSAGLVLGYAGWASYQFKTDAVWYPLVVPVLFQVPVAFVMAVLWKYRDSRKVEAAHERLKEMDRLKSMFLSHVSHELKTPLTSIKGFVDNMMDGLTGELQTKQREYLDRVRANADRLTRMITNLLDLSRIESGTQRLEKVRVRALELVEEVIDQLRSMAAAKALSLEVVCPDPTVQIVADRDKFIQIMTNLVENAVKFTPPGGKITLTIGTDEPDRVMITVTDTGEGIQADLLDRLFKPFYQASRQPGTHVKGLGLGLSIVKTLVELHEGTISVTSEVGKGSEFRIIVPAPKQGEA